MEEFLNVGSVTSAHGVKGEVKVFPLTDDVNRFKKLKEVYLENKTGRKTVHIESVKFFKQFVILKFEEYNSMNEAELLKGSYLSVERKNAVRLSKDEYFIADLIGLKVIGDDDSFTGTLTDVMQTGANDVYVVESEEFGEVLLPAIKDCILDVNPGEGFVKVHLLPGLIDEN